jgi:excisionase family DNA binding protein
MALQELVSVVEAAKRLGGVSVWTIRAWMSQGRLKRTKVGSRTMVSASAIEEFLDQCAAAPKAAKDDSGK